jgi:hypothetical protein
MVRSGTRAGSSTPPRQTQLTSVVNPVRTCGCCISEVCAMVRVLIYIWSRKCSL